jgi:hypothetical protein
MSRCYPKEARPESAFTVVPRELHDTWTIKSDAAFRILSYMLGMPDTWTHSVRSLRRELHMGQARVEGALAELMALGYVTKEAARASGRWAVDYTAHYPPVEVDDEDDHSTVTGQPLRTARNGSAVTGDPSRVSRYGPPVHSKKGSPSKGVQERESKQGNVVDAREASEPAVGQEDPAAGDEVAPAPLDEEDTSSLATPASLAPTDPQTVDEIEIVRVHDKHEAGHELTVDERVTHAWGTYVLRMGKIHNYGQVKVELTQAFGEFAADEPPHLLAAAIQAWLDNPKAEVVTSARAARAFLATELTKQHRQSSPTYGAAQSSLEKRKRLGSKEEFDRLTAGLTREEAQRKLFA